MNKIYSFIISLTFCAVLNAQVVTVTNPTFTTPTLAATYTSLANAITALNTITAISGPVTINLNAGNNQTAPVGGYVINFVAATSAFRNIIITGNSNIITANAGLSPGSLTDALFKIVGADFVTIEYFSLRENPSNTNTAAATNNMTEWGVALLCSSAINGAQNNKIQNNSISLRRNYSNSFGIYSNTRHTSTTVNIAADVTSAAGANSYNQILNNIISNVNAGITLIGSADAAFMDTNNAILLNTITSWGGTIAESNFISNSGSIYCIYINHQKNDDVIDNFLSGGNLPGTSFAVRGIYKNYSNTLPTGTFVSTITGNEIRITHNFSSGILECIKSEGISTALASCRMNIGYNSIRNTLVNAVASSTTLVGISNTSQCGILTINGNNFQDNKSNATTGGFTAISNTGVIQTTLSITNNIIGSESGDAITFSGATSGTLTGITCATIAAGAALTILNNNFKGFVQTIAGTGNHIYITFSHAANSATIDNINSNTFTNIVANTSGNVNFISRSGSMQVLAGATENCNDNQIVTAFLKPVAGGTVTLYNANSGSLSGNFMVQTGNDFSYITLTGATIMNGWINTEGGLSGPTKTITGNRFSNWTCGSGSVNVIQSDNGGTSTSVSSNTISNINAAAALVAISIGPSNKGSLQTYAYNNIDNLSSSGNVIIAISGGSTSVIDMNVNNNTISNLTSTIASNNIVALSIEKAGTINIFKNKIYDITCNAPNSLVTGMEIQPFATGNFNIYNNLVGNLFNPVGSGPESIYGITCNSIAATASYKIYYNSIYLNASSTGTNFGVSGLVLTANAAANNGAASIRNNIVVNTSTPTGTAKAAAFKRIGISLGNFAASSNNNIFYAGVPSASNVIFYDGTNSDQTLAAYKTRVGPVRDAASLSEMPVFISTNPADKNYLHLDPLANCNIFGKGNNTGLLLAEDFDGELRSLAAPFSTDIGADEVKDKSIVWTGANGTSWNDISNWDQAIIPNLGYWNITVPSAPANQPIIEAGENFQVKNITIVSGASLINRGTLKIAGTISASSASINNLTAFNVTGSIEMDGPCGAIQTLLGNIFNSNAVKNFKISTDAVISNGATNQLKISGELSFGTVSSKTLSTNDNIILVSTADRTANVGIIKNGNIISGSLTVERFIPARRSWRLLTAPIISTATTTISQAWQGGQVATTIPPPVYTTGSGTLITASTIAADGFDKGSTNNPSIKFYNGAAWVAPANTNVLPIKTHPGYMLFVRGDRNISIGGTGVTATTTTLRPKNNINMGTQTINNLVGKGFRVIGNPFPSAINFHTTTKIGLGDNYRLWDPKIGGLKGVGGFVTFAWNTINFKYDRTVTGTGSSVLPVNGTIESGAAFIVSFTDPGKLEIKETDKVSTSSAAPFGRPELPSTSEGRISINLGFTDTDNSFALVDGVLVTYHSSYANEIDNEDIIKIKNTDEDFGISSGDKIIAIERRQPIQKNDTLSFAFTQPKVRTYTLQIIPAQLAVPGLTAFIEDKFTHTKTVFSLADTSYYSFATNAAEPGSYAEDRLRIIFNTSSINTFVSSFIQLQAIEQDRNILVEWKINQDYFVEKYIVEKSINGTDFITVSSIISNAVNVYQWLDKNAALGNNFYRIKKVGTNGEVEYSHVASVRTGKGETWAQIFPNPVTAGTCNLQIKNSVAGKYSLKLVNNIGQIVYTSIINYVGGQSQQTLKLPANITDGEYQVELISKDKSQTTIIPLLIKRK